MIFRIYNDFLSFILPDCVDVVVIIIIIIIFFFFFFFFISSIITIFIIIIIIIITPTKMLRISAHIMKI